MQSSAECALETGRGWISGDRRPYTVETQVANSQVPSHADRRDPLAAITQESDNGRARPKTGVVHKGVDVCRPKDGAKVRTAIDPQYELVAFLDDPERGVGLRAVVLTRQPANLSCANLWLGYPAIAVDESVGVLDREVVAVAEVALATAHSEPVRGQRNERTVPFGAKGACPRYDPQRHM